MHNLYSKLKEFFKSKPKNTPLYTISVCIKNKPNIVYQYNDVIKIEWTEQWATFITSIDFTSITIDAIESVRVTKK